MKVPASGGNALEPLQQALADERQALIEHDAQALIMATACKLQALQKLEAHPPIEQERHLRELADRNHANGLLLARRRHEINWALRYLGRSESTAYNAINPGNVHTTQ